MILILFINNLKKRKYYIQLLSYFAILSTVIVISLSIVFSNIYMSNLVEQVMGEYVNGLERLDRSIEDVFKQADQVYLSLQLNLDVFTYLNARDSDPETDNKAQICAQTMRQLSHYIHSIILYNGSIKSYISAGNSGYDPKKVLNGNLPDKRSSAKRNIRLIELDGKNSSNGEKNNVVSLIYTEYSIDYSRILNLIIINLDEQLMRQEILNRFDGITAIIGENGDIICGDVKNAGMLVKSIFSSVKSSGSNKGGFRLKSEKDLNVVTYIRDEASGWYLVNIKPYRSIVYEIQGKRNLIIVISLVFLLVCFVAIYFVSVRLYNPIRKAADVVYRSKPDADGSASGEINMIVNIYEETLSKMKKLEDINENSIPRLKEDFFRKLLKNELGEEPDENELSGLKISLEIDNVFVVVLKIDGYGKINEDRRHICETFISSGIPRILEEDFITETVNMFSGEICILLNFKNRGQNDFNTLLKALENLKEVARKVLGTSVIIGIGGVANSIKELGKAYIKAVEMAKYRFTLGYDRIIYQRYIDENLTSGNNYPLEIEERLINSIRLNKKDEFIMNVENIMEMLKNYFYYDAVTILVQLILECIRTMNQVLGHHATKRYKLPFAEFDSIFNELQTLEQVKDWLERLYEEYEKSIDEINSLKRNRFYKVIEQIKEYIDNNYANAGMGVEMLAEIAGYSPNYFAKVFRDMTGEHLTDYIRQVRIAKAKELLRNTDYKINDISNMTGFTNPSYFFSAFKKEVGLTPSAYKSRCLQK